MSQFPLKFQRNHPQVITEHFDDEVVAINLETGCYYNMEKSGALVWMLICQGVTFDEIMHEVEQRYLGERALIEPSIWQFMDELQQAQLVVQSTDSAIAQPDTPLRLPASSAKIAFTPPVLCEYTDMQELLLLDPIHEVSNQGWPVRQP